MSARAEEDRVRSALQGMLETGSTFPPMVGPAELRRRGSRRLMPRLDTKIVFGVAAAVVLIVALFTIAPHHKTAPGTASATTSPAGHGSNSFLMRPVLCYAPALQLTAGASASTGPLPTCSASTQLNAANLGVTPNVGNVNGYTSNGNIQPDPVFATYPSTSPAQDDPAGTVLLPGGFSAGGSARYVLGPAQLTGTAVQSATASLSNGQWSVDVTLTDPGSAAWDAFAHQQFHQIIGVDLNGQVLSAPIVQPTQSSFASFNGQLEISGFTQAQATTVANEIAHSN
jgi:preprotein translocase subunit SecD